MRFMRFYLENYLLIVVFYILIYFSYLSNNTTMFVTDHLSEYVLPSCNFNNLWAFLIASFSEPFLDISSNDSWESFIVQSCRYCIYTTNIDNLVTAATILQRKKIRCIYVSKCYYVIEDKKPWSLKINI